MRRQDSYRPHCQAKDVGLDPKSTGSLWRALNRAVTPSCLCFWEGPAGRKDQKQTSWEAPQVPGREACSRDVTQGRGSRATKALSPEGPGAPREQRIPQSGRGGRGLRPGRAWLWVALGPFDLQQNSTDRVPYKQYLFLPGLEAGSPTSWGQHSLVQTLFGSQMSHFIFTCWKGEGVAFLTAPTPFWRTPTSCPKRLPNVSPPSTIDMNLGGTQIFRP